MWVEMLWIPAFAGIQKKQTGPMSTCACTCLPCRHRQAHADRNRAPNYLSLFSSNNNRYEIGIAASPRSSQWHFCFLSL